jgi:hypothetical protein
MTERPLERSRPKCSCSFWFAPSAVVPALSLSSEPCPRPSPHRQSGPSACCTRSGSRRAVDFLPSEPLERPISTLSSHGYQSPCTLAELTRRRTRTKEPKDVHAARKQQDGGPN